MEQKLSISKENIDTRIVLKLTGRLDANWSGYLDDTLKELVQEGHYFVALDLTGISYLSSAGIRILVKQNKSFRAISGHLGISSMSDNVKTVLDMVGMLPLFKMTETVVTKPETTSDLHVYGYRFKLNASTESEPSPLIFSGSPNKMKTCSYAESDNQILKLDTPFFGLGIGAIGEGFADCKSRYGEFISLGLGVAYMPSDNTTTPDYAVRIGKLIPEINTIYHVGIEGDFQNEMIFTPEAEKSIELSSIIESAAKTGGHKNFMFLLIAETSGLIGSSLNVSPASGQKPFSFPEVRQHLNFTTEPAHNKALTVMVGVVSSEEKISAFVRPIGKGLQAHVHAAAFPYTPLRKESVNYVETIDALLNNSEVLDVLHLLNDTRDINGLGESTFKSGHIWTSEISI